MNQTKIHKLWGAKAIHDNALYRYIREFQAENKSESPSRRQMAEKFETSTSVITLRLRRLRKRGFIDYPNKIFKTIHILNMRTFRLWVCPLCDFTSLEENSVCPKHSIQTDEVIAREI
jgi:DNA-binding transcriptional MocR family regulator